MKAISICPRCAREYTFDSTICGFCRVPRHFGGEPTAEVALWKITETPYGRVFHPPESLPQKFHC
jgi:hypothetical protein